MFQSTINFVFYVNQKKEKEKKRKKASHNGLNSSFKNQIWLIEIVTNFNIYLIGNPSSANQNCSWCLMLLQ
jgi:hypothetical protein